MSEDGKITLKVATPAGVYEGVFDTTTKVNEAIAQIVKGKKLSEGDVFELAYGGEVLPGDSPLGSFGFEDGSVLDLIATGSAV